MKIKSITIINGNLYINYKQVPLPPNYKGFYKPSQVGDKLYLGGYKWVKKLFRKGKWVII